MAAEYLGLAAQFPPYRLKVVRAHVFKMLFGGLQRHTDLRDELATGQGFGRIRAVAAEMRRRRAAEAEAAEGQEVASLAWYYRWWPFRGTGGGFRLEEDEGEEGGGNKPAKGCVDLMACDDGAMGCLFGGGEDEEE